MFTPVCHSVYKGVPSLTEVPSLAGVLSLAGGAIVTRGFHEDGGSMKELV